MLQRNKTVVEEFILLAFADLLQVRLFLFPFFLLTYVTCLLGNVAIIFVVKMEHSLHTPMYFFISVLSILEIIFVSVTVPKLLAILIAHKNTISINGCFIQMYVFISLGVTECYLLMVMAYDRHQAINNPLRYPTVMTHTACVRLAVFPWVFGFSIILVPAILMAQLEFCGPNVIDHFFCDVAPLQSLACSDSFVSIMSTSFTAVSGIDITIPFLVIIGFYVCIIMTIIKIKSKEGKKKAFSTCTSHLIVTSLFFGTAIIVYVKPEGSHYDKYLAFMYTAITPTINPFIYTFRNRDVKKVFWNLLNQFMRRIC